MTLAIPPAALLDLQPPCLGVASAVEHYLLENPWPIAAALSLGALVVGWRALREGHRPTLFVAIGSLLAALVVIALGYGVTTNAERGTAVVSELVRRAERSDIPGMLELFTPQCLLHYGRPENPGRLRPDWERSIGLLQGRYTIESNTVTRLNGTSESGSAATIELACLTTVSAAPYPTPNVWWMRVAEQPDGVWRIERLACLRLGQQAPSAGAF